MKAKTLGKREKIKPGKHPETKNWCPQKNYKNRFSTQEMSTIKKLMKSP